ncbi:methyltransferase [Ignisphaera sp. 4213-co]|uniref:Methyltransferase n=1 Tax=Ignisphaera cupida TaxID=3050454 RepID=A0ABD4Z402_9CREN|nr:methyltransferase [Ignisphaera sp. 4213-co]MDK6027929.1 methyltransferase [Ignisphaera sp. 4213-co]
MSDQHYYSERVRRKGQYMLISDVVRGVTVEFEVVPGLFSYEGVDEGTKLLLEHAEIPSSGTVLDVGCGYGVIGITLAKLNPSLKVYMVDINKEAVRLAERNVVRNKLSKENIVILHGNLYEPVKNIVFDAIYSNPPFAAGSQVVEKIIVEAPQHLKKDGALQIVARKGAEKVENLMRKTFGNVEVKASKKGYKVLLSRKLDL